MKILVLGHTGFIGSNLFSRLRDMGLNVSGVSKSTGVDLRNYGEVRDCIEEHAPEVIYNVASHGGSLHYVREFAADVFYDNVSMALNLYQAVKEVDSSIKIIQPFSNCSYPGSSALQSEEEWLGGPVHPSVMSFGTSKRSIYYISKCFHDQYGIRSVNLLFPNTYGPGDSDDPNKTHALNGMIIRMLEAQRAQDTEFVVWGTGSPIREWVYVDDFIEVLVQALQIENMEYPTNVGQEKGYSIAESAYMIKQSIGFDGEIVFDTTKTDGDPIKILSNDKFQKYFPEVKFYEHTQGIDNTVLYYRDK